MDIEFKSAKELYKRVMPALKTRKRLLMKKGIKTSEKQIFEYLVKTRWSEGSNLALNDIVNDIINAELDNLNN